MNELAIATEIRARIERDLKHCHGQLPKGHALAWSGYLAAMFEWQLISADHYNRLCLLFPNISDDPALRILLDRPPKECSDPD
jgi:hypothetical protein